MGYFTDAAVAMPAADWEAFQKAFPQAAAKLSDSAADSFLGRRLGEDWTMLCWKKRPVWNDMLESEPEGALRAFLGTLPAGRRQYFRVGEDPGDYEMVGADLPHPMLIVAWRPVIRTAP